jgi:hypothetical protein
VASSDCSYVMFIHCCSVHSLPVNVTLVVCAVIGWYGSRSLGVERVIQGGDNNIEVMWDDVLATNFNSLAILGRGATWVNRGDA